MKHIVTIALACAATSSAFAQERPQDRWNLADLYASQEAWNADAAKLEASLARVAACKGKLGESAKRFKECTDGQYDALLAYLANPELALTTGQELASTQNLVGRPEAPPRYQSGWNHILDSKGIPVIQPPWFRLTAYDMNTGDIDWQVPVGEVPHLVEKGILNTGATVWVRGGPTITAGELIFVSAGEKLWAHDRETGAVLWSTSLPGVGEGIPAVYQVGGRQFVVISATQGGQGAPRLTTPRSPSYVAFALPR